jgi:hypothetical protein
MHNALGAYALASLVEGLYFVVDVTESAQDNVRSGEEGLERGSMAARACIMRNLAQVACPSCSLPLVFISLAALLCRTRTFLPSSQLKGVCGK